MYIRQSKPSKSQIRNFSPCFPEKKKKNDKNILLKMLQAIIMCFYLFSQTGIHISEQHTAAYDIPTEKIKNVLCVWLPFSVVARTGQVLNKCYRIISRFFMSISQHETHTINRVLEIDIRVFFMYLPILVCVYMQEKGYYFWPLKNRQIKWTSWFRETAPLSERKHIILLMSYRLGFWWGAFSFFRESMNVKDTPKSHIYHHGIDIKYLFYDFSQMKIVFFFFCPYSPMLR